MKSKPCSRRFIEPGTTPAGRRRGSERSRLSAYGRRDVKRGLMLSMSENGRRASHSLAAGASERSLRQAREERGSGRPCRKTNVSEALEDARQRCSNSLRLRGVQAMVAFATFITM
jgi:hypothetical protein